MNQHKVHFVYIVPADRQVTASDDIANCAKHLQAWYRWQMGNGKTFTLGDLVVGESTLEASWFSTHNPDERLSKYPSPFGAQVTTDTSGWFWQNTLDEAWVLAGAGFGQPLDDWVIYIDAPLAHGQYVGGASVGFSGVCVLPEQDVRAVQGLDPQYTLCRELGGCGHEIGHTFGLAHPDGSPDWRKAIMGVGYTIYPNAILTQDEKDYLNTSPFFSVRGKLPQPDGLCPFDDNRPRPLPRPRPTPYPRT